MALWWGDAASAETNPNVKTQGGQNSDFKSDISTTLHPRKIVELTFKAEVFTDDR